MLPLLSTRILSKLNHREHGEKVKYQYAMRNFISSSLCPLWFHILSPRFIKFLTLPRPGKNSLPLEKTRYTYLPWIENFCQREKAPSRLDPALDNPSRPGGLGRFAMYTMRCRALLGIMSSVSCAEFPALSSGPQEKVKAKMKRNQKSKNFLTYWCHLNIDCLNFPPPCCSGGKMDRLL